MAQSARVVCFAPVLAWSGPVLRMTSMPMLDPNRIEVARSLVFLAGREGDSQDYSGSVERGRSGMSTGLSMGVLKPGACELVPPSAEADASSVITGAQTVEAKPIAPAGRRLSPFGLVLYPETVLHQGIVSLADQAVASATNFVTGVIIARACSKEEFGL